jgi:hypothetical protein
MGSGKYARTPEQEMALKERASLMREHKRLKSLGLLNNNSENNSNVLPIPKETKIETVEPQEKSYASLLKHGLSSNSLQLNDKEAEIYEFHIKEFSRQLMEKKNKLTIVDKDLIVMASYIMVKIKRLAIKESEGDRFLDKSFQQTLSEQYIKIMNKLGLLSEKEENNTEKELKEQILESVDVIQNIYNNEEYKKWVKQQLERKIEINIPKIASN